MGDYEISPEPFYVNEQSNLQVYDAIYLPSQSPVVIKAYTYSSFTQASSSLNDAVTQALIEHPCIVQLLNVTLKVKEHGFVLHVILEKCQRDMQLDVEDRSKQQNPYSEDELVLFLSQVASGLAYAKTKGVSHQDLRPSNIFLGLDGVYKVADFSSRSLGTPLYFSPQLREVHLDLRPTCDLFQADVYALGITLMHLASLAPPMDFNTFSDLYDKIETELRAIKYSDWLKDVLRRMLEREETDRMRIEELVEIAGDRIQQRQGSAE